MLERGVWGGALSDAGLVWGQSQKDILSRRGAVPSFPAVRSLGRDAERGARSTVSCWQSVCPQIRNWHSQGWGRAEELAG